ncbi:uncharacterized protein V1516DRAFT_677454 [Lipomyces oligophaga]|uniref:uncharacterized protein n=1 Tax=Lipomyces oligophaga TaxID=45792 RepID=UPI0034CEF540
MDSTSLSYKEGYLTINGSLSDHLLELAAYVDVLNGFVAESDEQLGPLTSQIAPLVADDEQVADEKYAEAIGFFFNAAGSLTKASEKDFETAYNLVIHVITLVPTNQRSHLETLLALLRDASQTLPLPTLSVLTNVFNLLTPDSPDRQVVFWTVVKVCVDTDKLDLLLPQLKQFPTWFEEWSLDAAAQIKFLTEIALALESVESKYVLKYLQEAHSVALSSSISINVESSLKLVLCSLRDIAFSEYESILIAIGAAAIPSDLLELLKIFVSGTLSEFRAFIASNPTTLSTYSLSEEDLTTKIRLLTLASLAASSPNLTVVYSAITSALLISEEDVELWIIDVIRAGLLEGKMSQLEGKLFIHRVATRTFGEPEWREIARRLDAWRTNLRDIQGVVRNARVSVEHKVSAINLEKEKTALVNGDAVAA